MKTAGFISELTSDGQIRVPREVASEVPPGVQVQVALWWGPSDDETAWRSAGRHRFEAAYVEDDSVYESLIDDPSPR